jgi:VanZ family protein
VVGSSNLLDAFAHAGAYAALTVAALVWPTRRPTLLTFFARAVVVLAFGVALEEAQRLVGRDAQIGDVGANALGVLAGLVIALLGRAAFRAVNSSSVSANR